TPEQELADVFAAPGGDTVDGGVARPTNAESALASHVSDAKGADDRPAGPSREMRYVDAIQDGLRLAMRGDPRIVLLGQDIAEYGGVFKVTEGFVKEFGKERVRNTPIIESGALGAAFGLALEGFTPM